MDALPPNVHISKHPCLRAKLSQLRSSSASSRETKQLVHEIGLILGIEALSGLEVVVSGTGQTPIGFEYNVETIHSASITLVPILRSGLGLIDAIQTILPEPVSVHHLGLFREKISLQPVEYYNNLPQTIDPNDPAATKLAIIVDPVIATGGTAAAAIQTLREWGVQKIIVISVLGAVPGVQRAAQEWPEGTDIWIGGVDSALTDKGMIQPGIGDIGDRLFLTLGK